MRKILMIWTAVLVVILATVATFGKVYWPAVTDCTGCGHRVWVWQRHTEKQHEVRITNPQRLPISAVHLFSIVHEDCTPPPKDFELILFQSPDSVGVKFIPELSLPPKARADLEVDQEALQERIDEILSKRTGDLST